EPGVIYQDDINTSKPNRIAVIDVKGWGVIRFELYDNMTPITTANFVKLAESGFYDGIKFHRCIDDFVAQTGDPNTRDNNPYNDGSGGSDETIPLEIHPNATHVDGAVGMARSSEPDSASSQFYICDGPQHGLDDIPRMEESGEHGYAVFGVVIEGLEVAKAIAACETYGYMRPALKDHPVDDIIMVSVTIEEGEWPVLDEEYRQNADNGSFIESEGGAGAFGIVTVIGILMVVAALLWAVVFRKRK
ncbi:MAG: peptidylprolyl isomerase, partial [Candidatus Thermoplasmatota archaeon]|nr:peptidylprolyl isomerase [Candidatus Thermoplasmatota archaeon]